MSPMFLYRATCPLHGLRERPVTLPESATGTATTRSAQPSSSSSPSYVVAISSSAAERDTACTTSSSSPLLSACIFYSCKYYPCRSLDSRLCLTPTMMLYVVEEKGTVRRRTCACVEGELSMTYLPSVCLIPHQTAVNRLRLDAVICGVH